MANGASVRDILAKGLACYHCGDECRKDHIQFDGKDFCCNGCKTVYEILGQNGLYTYYDLEKNPGVAVNEKISAERFSFLENEEIQKNLLLFRDDHISKVSFHIPSIHCSSCIWLLENLSRLGPGIISSRVNFNRKEVQIVFHHTEISLRETAVLLSSIGYEPYISLEQGSRDRYSAVNRDLLVKIGIAGFSFGNTMLLSFPEYFGFEGIQDIFLQRTITWLSAILSVPVIFYCALDYFKSALAGIRQRFINIDIPVSLGIISLFAVSFYQVISGSGPGYFDSLSGLVFFLLIGKWVQNLTYEGLSFDRDYRSYFPMAATKIEGGRETPVPAITLMKGDVILVRNNEIIPADSIQLDKEGYVNYSFITGETELILKKKGDLIYAGGRHTGPSVRLSVVKPVSRSYLTRLWNNEAFSGKETNEFQRLIDIAARYFTAIILIIAACAFLLWSLTDLSKAVFIFTAVLIVACPCALVMATPFTLGNAMRILGRNRFYIKNIQVIEKLTRVDQIVFDKTGTLTEGTASAIEYDGTPLTSEELELVKSTVRHSTHPLSRRISDFLPDEIHGDKTVDAFEEIPGTGIIARVNGCDIRAGSRKLMDGSEMYKEPEGNSGSRYSTVFLSINRIYKGRFNVRNKYRENIHELARTLGENYKISVLSGDSDGERHVLNSIFPHSAEILFRQEPEGKLNYIKKLREQGRNVMMLGDGLNDAGALKISNLGVAVTDDITLFTPASDVIMDGRNLSNLPLMIRFSHAAKKVIIASFIISFLYNIVGLGFAVSGNLSPVIAAILMPASSISVVLFSTIMINFLARIYDL